MSGQGPCDRYGKDRPRDDSDDEMRSGGQHKRWKPTDLTLSHLSRSNSLMERDAQMPPIRLAESKDDPKGAYLRGNKDTGIFSRRMRESEAGRYLTERSKVNGDPLMQIQVTPVPFEDVDSPRRIEAYRALRRKAVRPTEANKTAPPRSQPAPQAFGFSPQATTFRPQLAPSNTPANPFQPQLSLAPFNTVANPLQLQKNGLQVQTTPLQPSAPTWCQLCLACARHGIAHTHALRHCIFPVRDFHGGGDMLGCPVCNLYGDHDADNCPVRQSWSPEERRRLEFAIFVRCRAGKPPFRTTTPWPDMVKAYPGGQLPLGGPATKAFAHERFIVSPQLFFNYDYANVGFRFLEDPATTSRQVILANTELAASEVYITESVDKRVDKEQNNVDGVQEKLDFDCLYHSDLETAA